MTKIIFQYNTIDLFHQEVAATTHVSLLVNNICLWFQKLFHARTHPSFIYSTIFDNINSFENQISL